MPKPSDPKFFFVNRDIKRSPEKDRDRAKNKIPQQMFTKTGRNHTITSLPLVS